MFLENIAGYLFATAALCPGIGGGHGRGPWLPSLGHRRHLLFHFPTSRHNFNANFAPAHLCCTRLTDLCSITHVLNTLRLQVNKCLSIKGAEDTINKPFAFEISTNNDSMFFIAESEKVRRKGGQKEGGHCKGGRLGRCMFKACFMSVQGMLGSEKGVKGRGCVPDVYGMRRSICQRDSSKGDGWVW